MSQPSSETAEADLPNAESRGGATERVSVRKKKFIKYGRRIARLRMGRTREIFTIHEELLCAHSPYFREKLQKNRKPIEGECSICHEEMTPTKKELTFCRSGCGGNFHYQCMETWVAQKFAASEFTVCPLCRKAWNNASMEGTFLCPDVPAESFEVYQEWLYQQQLTFEVDDAHSSNNMPFNDWQDTLLAAYSLGVKIKDRGFCRAVLRAIAETSWDADRYPGPAQIKVVYENTSPTSRIREYLVEVYAMCADDEWFDEEDYNLYPAEFMRSLTKLLLQKRACKDNPAEELEDIKAKYCDDDEEEEKEED